MTITVEYNKVGIVEKIQQKYQKSDHGCCKAQLLIEIVISVNKDIKLHRIKYTVKKLNYDYIKMMILS